MRNDSCFWAVNALASSVVAAVFLVLFIFGQLPAASIGIWIVAAVAVIVLLALLLRESSAAPAAAAAGGMGSPAHAQPCRGWFHCTARRIGIIAAAALAVGFSAAFLSTAAVPASVAALVFFFLAVAAFTFKLIALAAYAACRLG